MRPLPRLRPERRFVDAIAGSSLRCRRLNRETPSLMRRSAIQDERRGARLRMPCSRCGSPDASDRAAGGAEETAAGRMTPHRSPAGFADARGTA